MSLAPPLPLSWLIHTVSYRARKKSRSAFGDAQYEDPIEIRNVRYDQQTSYSRTNQENTLNYNGILFIDGFNSVGYPGEFVENSIINFKGQDLTIKRVVTCYQINSDLIHHYEIEVI